MGSWSLVKKKDSMFDSLAKQSEKDAKRIQEKWEKANEQEKAEKKKAEKQVNSSKDKAFVTASSHKELLVRAKEALEGTTGKTLTKEERALGRGVDYRV